LCYDICAVDVLGLCRTRSQFLTSGILRSPGLPFSGLFQPVIGKTPVFRASPSCDVAR
jgi:hypothetical protein